MQTSSRLPVAASAIILLLSVVAMGSYTWYALRLSCDIRAVERASAFLIRQRDSFDHSYQFATSASRDAIVRPVAELQQILMDTMAYPVPACLRTAKNELVQFMGAVVHAFLAYGAQESDATIREWLEKANEHYLNFPPELEAINECAPLCLGSQGFLR